MGTFTLGVGVSLGGLSKVAETSLRFYLGSCCITVALM